MRREYYQVVGSGPWVIDHRNGDSKAYTPGMLFEESPLNPSVVRGLRTKRLRQCSVREANARRLHAQPVVAQPKPGLPKAKSKPKSAPAAPPLVVIEDDNDK